MLLPEAVSRWLHGWNIAVQHQPSRREHLADLIGQSAARIDFQSCVLQQQGWLDRCEDCLGIVGNAQHATATAPRGTRPGVIYHGIFHRKPTRPVPYLRAARFTPGFAPPQAGRREYYTLLTLRISSPCLYRMPGIIHLVHIHPSFAVLLLVRSHRSSR